MSSDRVQRLLALLEQLKVSRRKAAETDYVMPIWLPYVGLIIALPASIAVAIAVAAEVGIGSVHFTIVGTTLGLLFLALFIGGLIRLYVLYKWISRLNEHLKRTALFYSTLADTAKELGLPQAHTMRSQAEEMKLAATTGERSPVLWIVLSIIIPLLILYVYHFLNRDFASHSRKEYAIVSAFANGIKELAPDAAINPDSLYIVPSRSTILYIILTLVTGGVFEFYWVYTLTADPNRHFITHAGLEDEIIRAVESAINKIKAEEAQA